MTCIVGVVDGDAVWMGGDSAAVAGWNLIKRRDSKVFKNGPFLIGFTTSFRMGQLLRYSFKPPEALPGRDVFEFMVNDFVDAVRECLKAGGFAKKENEQEEAGSFLVGFNGRLFEISEDYQVGESVNGYMAIGCGFAYALGSLRTASTEPYSAEYRIEGALGAAAYFSAAVSGPFVIEMIK